MDGWINQMIYESMDWWTVHRHPSPIFFGPPPATTDFTDSNTFLIFFGMEEFVRDGGRVDRNNELM